MPSRSSIRYARSRACLILCIALLTAASAVLDASELPAWKQALAPKTEAWKKTRQHFIFNNGAEPEGLDPAVITGVSEGRLADALFEGLVTLDPKSLQPRPGVAERWEVSADGLTYTFHLRPNARWSNGAPVTAQDFAASWQRVLTPATACEYAYQLYYIEGAEDFHRRKIMNFAKVGIQAQTPRLLRVKLHSPCAYWLELCAFHTLLPVPMHVVNAHKARWTQPENIVCNGAFVLKEWSLRSRIVMTKNPHYWDRGFVKLDRVTALPLDDLDTAYRLYLQGKVHWLSGLPLPKLEEIKRHPDYYVSPYLGTYYYLFNVTKPPFDDARVRQAFAMALDRKVITEHVTKGGQQPATWFCPAMGNYKPPKGLGYDRDRARQLLAEAGYGSAPFPQVELLYNTSDNHKRVAEAIAKQWEMNLGVRVSLANTEWKVYLARTRDRDYTIARAGWIGDYTDPNTFLDMWVTGGGNNRTGWSNKEYDKLIRAAQGELNPKKRLQLFHDAERILVRQELPIMPIYTYVNQGMLHESVLGWHENIRDWHPLKYIWLEE